MKVEPVSDIELQEIIDLIKQGERLELQYDMQLLVTRLAIALKRARLTGGRNIY